MPVGNLKIVKYTNIKYNQRIFGRVVTITTLYKNSTVITLLFYLLRDYRYITKQ